MITIATMESNNPLLILAAMTANMGHALLRGVWGLTTTTIWAAIALLASSWRVVALALAVVAGVALAAVVVMVFWWVLVQLAGGLLVTAVTAYGLKWLWGI